MKEWMGITVNRLNDSTNRKPIRSTIQQKKAKS